MVLPAPAAHAEPVVADGTWIERIALAFRLSRGRGVMVLVDKARHHRLRSVALALLPEHPDLEVLTSVGELENAPDGAAVVFVPREEDGVALNLGRQMVAHRRLCVVLWCEDAVTKALVRDAPDFIDWVSHRVECDDEVPRFAVAGLKAADEYALGVVWKGGDLERVRAAAGIEMARVLWPALGPYDAKWWLVADVPDAALETMTRQLAVQSRHCRVVVESRTSEVIGWWTIHASPIAPYDAVRALPGLRRAGLLAALLENEPEAIALVVNRRSPTATYPVEAILIQQLMALPDPALAVVPGTKSFADHEQRLAAGVGSTVELRCGDYRYRAKSLRAILAARVNRNESIGGLLGARRLSPLWWALARDISDKEWVAATTAELFFENSRVSSGFPSGERDPASGWLLPVNTSRVDGIVVLGLLMLKWQAGDFNSTTMQLAKSNEMRFYFRKYSGIRELFDSSLGEYRPAAYRDLDFAAWSGLSSTLSRLCHWSIIAVAVRCGATNIGARNIRLMSEGIIADPIGTILLAGSEWSLGNGSAANAVRSWSKAEVYLESDSTKAIARWIRGRGSAMLGHYSDAVEYCQSAVAMMPPTLTGPHPMVGTFTLTLGRALAQMARYDEALDCFARVPTILDHRVLPTHPDRLAARIEHAIVTEITTGVPARETVAETVDLLERVLTAKAPEVKRYRAWLTRDRSRARSLA